MADIHGPQSPQLADFSAEGLSSAAYHPSQLCLVQIDPHPISSLNPDTTRKPEQTRAHFILDMSAPENFHLGPGIVATPSSSLQQCPAGLRVIQQLLEFPLRELKED